MGTSRTHHPTPPRKQEYQTPENRKRKEGGETQRRFPDESIRFVQLNSSLLWLYRFFFTNSVHTNSAHYTDFCNYFSQEKKKYLEKMDAFTTGLTNNRECLCAATPVELREARCACRCADEGTRKRQIMPDHLSPLPRSRLTVSAQYGAKIKKQTISNPTFQHDHCLQVFRLQISGLNDVHVDGVVA